MLRNFGRKSLIKWLGNLKIVISNLSNREIILGKPKCDDELFVNHVLIIAKPGDICIHADVIKLFLCLGFL